MTETVTEQSTFEERAEEVLACTFRGIHNAPKVHKENHRWTLNKYGGMATFDNDTLTRLVVSCHKFCIRAEIKSSGPGMVKVVLWPRRRTGAFHERHPNIQEAIESV